MRLSVIIPTRGRPKQFRKACASIFDMAYGKVEVIARLDADDPMREEYEAVRRDADTAYRRGAVYLVVGPRLGGYSSNHDMIDHAAQWAGGALLMQFVDDAEIITPLFDSLFWQAADKREDEIFVLSSRVTVAAGPAYNYSFPVISRKLYDLVGGLSLGNPSVDRCWGAFAEAGKCGIETDVEIFHRDAHLVDPTDRTAVEGRIPFCADLQADFEARSKEHQRIGQAAWEKVKAAL